MRSIARARLLTLGVAVLTLAGCQGISGSSDKASASANGACADGTVASYLGTSCSQGQAVFKWLSYSCTSTPSSLCDGLGTNGSNLKMRIDGPHTILVGGTTLWNVNAGQNVRVVINGSVYGARTNLNWPHFDTRGQTGDGTEDNKTTVDCAGSANCIDLDGISDVPCSASGPAAYCTDQSVIAPYQVETARFNAATSDNPYALTIEIVLNGGSMGTATLHSVGIHVGEN